MRIKFHTVAALLAAAAFLPIIAACDDAGARSNRDEPAKRIELMPKTHVTDGAVGRAMGALDGDASSPRQLVENVLDAVALSDTAALVNLLVDADEYDRVVYPELGAHYAAARDTRRETRQFLWENQRLDALKGMRSALRELGGRRLTFVTVEFTEGEKLFPSYRLMEGAVVSVTDADGAPATLHLLGTMIEKDGRFKLLSYRDID